MKFSALSLTTVVAILQTTSALKTFYVTEKLTTTIYGDQGEASATVVVQQATSPAAAKVVAADSSSSETTLATSTEAETSAAAATTSSSSSDSGIYADIYKSSGLDADFAKSILDAHNEKRALHSSPELSWDKTTYEYAQAYADKYDCSGSLTHSGGVYGENLAVGYSDGVAALDAWYSEGDNYNYNSPTYNHFTAVVWKSTTKLGCAIKDCSAKNWGHYVICSYNPAGNIVGQSAENVLSS